ncbi:MAG: pentapeptide repeat-containing protein [Nitrospinae bacterium]|nr:pentapeptide repeat-containing protein [Nitrospinota bacterium]
MAIEEHLNTIKQGVDTWNQWREDNPNEVPDLSKADIRGCKLQKINLSNADLKEAKLQYSNLYEANLEKADLTKAKLLETNLQSANLKNANLSGAGLLESNLQFTNLENAKLEKAQFNEGTIFNQTNIKGALLEGATGLSSSQISLAQTDSNTQLPDYLEEELDDDFLLQM